MNAPEHNSAAEELLRHAQWVRGLARALVSDDAAAEDVVQETMVAALTHPPSSSRLRPWLGEVVRNFARLHHRSSGRRREHEGGARGPSGLPGPEELSERLEAEQRLTRELARLDEPFRSTLMHRYYDNLEPVEIAERLGVPGGTVRWRLKRGLEILRARLDDAHDGDRRAWSLALLPLARIESSAALGATVSSIALPGLVLMNALKLVGAAAAVFVIAVGLAVTGVLPETLVPWSLADAPAPVEFRPLEAPVVAVPAQPLLEPEQSAERVAAVAPPAPEPEPEAIVAGPGPMVFDAVVLGDGVPLAGAQMVVEIYGMEWGEPQLSGRGGAVSTSLTRGDQAVSATIAFHAPGFASVALETRGEPGLTTHLGRIDLAPGGSVSGVVLDEHGRGLADCTVTVVAPGTSKRQLEGSRFQHAHITVPSTLTDELGRFQLGGVPTGMIRLWGHADDYLSGFTAPIEVRVAQESFGVEFELEPLGPENLVRGIVLAPDGTPIADADLRYRNTSPSSGTTYAGNRNADSEGRFEFLLLDDAQLSLTAADPEQRWGKVTVADIGTGNLDLVLQLSEEVLVTLQVSAPGGAPVLRFALEVLERGGEHELASLPPAPRPEGTAQFALPTTSFIVRITAPGFDLRELGPLDPELQAGQLLTAVLVPLPGLHGIVLRDGAPAAGVRVALHEQVEAPRMRVRNGFRMRMNGGAVDDARTDDEGRFLLTPRSSGGYFVRAEPQDGAPSEFGPFDVSRDLSGPDVELHLAAGGAIEGHVVLAGGADPVGAIVGLTRGDGNARTLRVGADGLFRFEGLMAGPWQLLLRAEELRPGTTSTTSSGSGGDAPFDDWSCTVFDGETTYFDLLEVPHEYWTFTGRLTINGQPGEDWTAALVPLGSMEIDGGPKAMLNRNGEFELRATRPGRQRLVLRGTLGERAEQYLVDEVNVDHGTWSHDLEVGVLTVEGLADWDEQGIPRVVHYWKGRGDLFCVTMFVPDEDGRARIERAPAGESKLVVPARTFDPEQWEVLRELRVEARAEQTVSLP